MFGCPPPRVRTGGPCRPRRIESRIVPENWALDDDGRPETLRLLCGAPARWLEDGKVLIAERAPTMFGPVSSRAESHLGRGEVALSVDPPSRRPGRFLVRLPLPPWRKVVAARAVDADLPVGSDHAIGLSEHESRASIVIRVSGSSCPGRPGASEGRGIYARSAGDVQSPGWPTATFPTTIASGWGAMGSSLTSGKARLEGLDP